MIIGIDEIDGVVRIDGIAGIAERFEENILESPDFQHYSFSFHQDQYQIYRIEK